MKTNNLYYIYILFAIIVMAIYGKLVIFAFVAYYLVVVPVFIVLSSDADETSCNL